MPDGFGGIQALWAYVDAILNAMASKHAEGVVQLCQAVFSRRITAVGKKPISLE